MRPRPLFPPPTSPATGKPKRHKGKQAFSLVSINGQLRLRRIRWHCPSDGSDTPIDRLLDLAESTISEGVREMACRVNQHASSFRSASEILQRAAHIGVSKETLRQLVETEGKTVLQAMRNAKLCPNWSAADCTTEQETARVYLGCDGVKVPLVTDEEKKKRRQTIRQKRRRSGRKCKPLPRAKAGADNAYKEFKVGVLYDETKKHRYVAVTSGNHEAAGRMLRRMSRQVELDRADERVAIIDGAPWIRNQIDFHGLTSDIGLDFYHLQDYAQKTRRAVFGEAGPGQPSEEGRRWVGDLMHTFKHDGYDAAWEQLGTWRKPLRGAKRSAANSLLQYVAERHDMIRYPEFRQNHWQIGSGPTEAECKTTTSRVKGRGRRWDARNAEAIMALTALQDSRMWNQHWQNLDPQRN
jgi:hypothetical protein